MRLLRALLCDEAAASAAEFALVLPGALLLIFGTIDVGRWTWTLNEVEKAVQDGARAAVVTDPVAGGLNTADFLNACPDTLVQGDPIDCADAFPTITCTSTGCDCPDGDCGPVDAAGTFNADAFTQIVARMRRDAPYIDASLVTVTYRPSGIGYYGDPACLGSYDKDGGCSTGELSDVSPLVTVQVAALAFRPLAFGLLDAGLRIPSRSYTLTLEDGVGTRPQT